MDTQEFGFSDSLPNENFEFYDENDFHELFRFQQEISDKYFEVEADNGNTCNNKIY